MNNIEYRAPKGTIKTSRNGWEFVSSTEDVDNALMNYNRVQTSLIGLDVVAKQEAYNLAKRKP